ncbi:MAG: sigma-70 family RNA polymerase sigma factor [Gemmatales bacterium]|nr:sigma-70 family RNA polymerase sigma factor [Gemmatales bacterium]MCS7161565.1 sigma-70 family RNA polymerase sigma factor [Gemmatales bacterium]MDW8176768.1 sigma-70 family RNA polymerase sigma factor [Gemmatales bacterium]MDW8222882.1 sigma-70 family RNA polymerase sigma factor [Gemmatales bacterium]
MADDDRTLIARCLQGRVEAFGELVRRYQDRLYNAVYRFLGNAEDARDVVQEAFLSAFRSLRRFRGGSQFFTWLYRIAINHAVDCKRRSKPVRALSEADQDHPKPEPADPSVFANPDWQLQRLEEDERLQQALSQLSSEYRMVLILRDIDELSYEQIADILDIPLGTVRSRLHRARLELRRLLEQMEKDSSSSSVFAPELKR